MPEMNEVLEKASKKSVRAALWVIFLQNIGLFIGVFSLFTLAYFQDDFNIE